MKLKRIIAPVLALAMVISTMSFTALAETTPDRSIVMTPSKDPVSTGETFTITVSVSHNSEDLKFASWDLTYTKDLFTLVKAELASPYVADENVLVINRNDNPLTPDVYATAGNRLTGDIMIYTFKANQTPTTDEPFKFNSNDVRTGNDGWTGEDVSEKTEVTDADVTINERQFSVTQWYDGSAVTSNTVTDIYDNATHTFSVTADLEDTDEDTTTPTITYTLDGVNWSADAPTFEEANTYSVTYKIERSGYTPVTKTVTVNMKTAAFEDVTIGFTSGGTTADITSELNDNAYEFHYDGSAHQLVVTNADTIDGSDVTITYKLGNGQATTEAPEITDAGVYTITYIITAPNHTTIEMPITVTIEEPVKVVEVLLTEEGDYTNDNKMVLVYTDAERVSFTYEGAQMYDVSGGEYKYNGQPYKHVFALVVPAIDENTLAAYEAKVGVNYGTISQNYVVNYTSLCDVNSSGEVDSNDIIAAYTVLEDATYAPMMGVIKLDNDFSKTARDSDITPIISQIYGKNNG